MISKGLTSVCLLDHHPSYHALGTQAFLQEGKAVVIKYHLNKDTEGLMGHQVEVGTEVGLLVLAASVDHERVWGVEIWFRYAAGRGVVSRLVSFLSLQAICRNIH